MIAIIKNSDKPEIAKILTDENGNNLMFGSFDDADDYLMKNAESGIGYKCFDGSD